MVLSHQTWVRIPVALPIYSRAIFTVGKNEGEFRWICRVVRMAEKFEQKFNIEVSLETAKERFVAMLTRNYAQRDSQLVL